MSCMELTQKHYQFIADQLMAIDVKFNCQMPFRATRQKLGERWSDAELKIISFITNLQIWNQKAWDTRHPNQADLDDSFDQVNETQPTSCNIPQLLKALECIDYQCTDADEWEASEHKQFLDLICADCRDYLISELPEYKAAQWGIE